MSVLQCDEALVILQEECAEVIQVISKMHRFGLRGYNPITAEYNDQLLNKEVGDLLCMIDICIKNNILKEADLEFYKDQKRDKLKKWSNL
jgi:hypothetical protein